MDESIVSEGYAIPELIDKDDHLINLTLVDWNSIEVQITAGRKRTETERLKNLLEQKINAMMQLNKTRQQFLERRQ